jgi:HAE1 family hydrophobic/amphiphilic exporter-1
VSSVYRRRVALTLLFLTFVLVSGFFLRGIRFGSSVDTAGAYTVITRHPGVNAEEIEQTITAPLEDLVADLPGVREIRSTSELGQSRVLIRLHAEIDDTRFYLALRDRVSRAHARFPPSTQKPRIVSSSRSYRPVFIAAFSSSLIESSRLRDLIEKEIKPDLERIPGTGEVDIGGGGLREIRIEVEAGKGSLYGQTPVTVAGALQSQHLLLPLGRLEQLPFDVPLTLKGRLESLDGIRNLPLPASPGRSIRLGDIAAVSYAYRLPESISRVDGSQRVVAYVYGGGKANLILLSRALRDKFRSYRNSGYEVTTIYDQGARMQAGLWEVAAAIGAGIISLAVFLLLLLPSIRLVLLLACEFPVVVFLSAGILTALGVSIDRHVLVGMAVGVGLIIDVSLVISHALMQSPGTSMRRLIAPLVSSTLTTLVVFLPLYAMESSAPGIRSISLAVSVMLFVALVLNFLFLPPFFVSGFIREKIGGRENRPASGLRSLYLRYMRRTLRRPLPFVGGYCGAIAVCVLAFALVPKNLSLPESEQMLFAQLEFPSGTNLQTVDRRTARFVESLEEAPFVTRVQSQAKRGKAELSLEYARGRIDAAGLIRYLRGKAASVPEGSLFFDEPPPIEGIRLECAVTGPDHGTLKSLARRVVQDLIAEPWVSDGVLHFKEDPPALVFRPDMERLFTANLTLAEVASALRWSVQGPVALKWVEHGRELDLRVFGESRRSLGREDLNALPIAGAAGRPIRLAQLGTLSRGAEPARLYRYNRQNAVFFSVTVAQKDVDTLVEDIGAVVAGARLPSGYGFVLDPELKESQRRFKAVWLLFVIAMFLVYVVIAVQTESFKAPLLVLSIVPISAGVPILLLAAFGTPLELSVIIGCIILSGMSVNNSILVYDSWASGGPSAARGERRIAGAMLRRTRPLLLTSGTTVIGSIPLLIAARGVAGFTGSLAFVVVVGVAVSVLAALLFLPALLALFQGRRG